MNKTELIRKVREMKDITSDEKAYLIDLINTKKKYGLMWEDKPEDVEEQLRRELPVFKDLKDRAIISDDVEAPNHILIEGDNLHALTALTFTHKGKIDVIYIDPPYNTGNKDFIYNDKYVDKEDSYRHSKWLSFMEKRLRLAYELMSDNGVIFLSIDDNENAQLKLLCDEVFGSNNGIGCFIQNKLNSKNDSKNIQKNHEYILVYSKLNNDKISILNDVIYKEQRVEKLGDKYFIIKDPITTRADGGVLNKRPNLGHTIYFNEKTGDLFAECDYDYNLAKSSNKELEVYNTNKKHLALGYEAIRPPTVRGMLGAWTWSLKKINDDKESLLITGAKGKRQVRKIEEIIDKYVVENNKKYFCRTKSITNCRSIIEFSTNEGSETLNNILGYDTVFNNPKNVNMIKYLISIYSLPNPIILDFFAGSGTTLHATLELNNEDDGKRQCILVTNNENNIAEVVTYERNKRVIEGYQNLKGEQIEGLTTNNLRYYKTDFVPSNTSEKNRRLLTKRSTDLICIKEDCYTDITDQYESIQSHLARIFTDNKGKYLVVIYHSFVQFEVIQELIKIIPTLGTDEKVKVYSFSPEKETIDEEFLPIIDMIDSVPLPESIYNTYKQCFKSIKLDRKPVVEPEKTDDNVLFI